MFVRWKERPPRRYGRRTRSAQLVRSVRVGGRPRQRVVCHLGSVRVGGEQHHWCRVDFWRVADRNLARSGLDPATRTRVEAVLAATVPRPDEASARDPKAALGYLSRKFRKPF